MTVAMWILIAVLALVYVASLRVELACRRLRRTLDEQISRALEEELTRD